MEGEL